MWPAPLDVVLDREQHLIVQPNLLFVNLERLGIVTDRVWGAPDLVVEILSPGSEALDRGYKQALYARYEVAEYWIVDPKAKVIEVYRLAPSGFERRGHYQPQHQFASPLFPGEEVFRAE